MKVMHSALLSLVIGLSANAALANSSENNHAMPENRGCHLLTAPECQAHLGKLSQLSVGQEREAYLAAHRTLVHERASMCGSQLNPFLIRASYR
jgi:hypothetical protein